MAQATFGAGCFWGVETAFRRIPGVVDVAVGYTGGHLENPTYKDVCTGRTGHAEAVLVDFDPAKVSFEQLLDAFWSSHDPTQLNRQGPDVGTQYRSAIYTTTDAQLTAAKASRELYQTELTKAGRGQISTEILPAGPYYYAERYHQQYLDKNSKRYCNHGFNGVSCPIGLGVPAQIEIEKPADVTS